MTKNNSGSVKVIILLLAILIACGAIFVLYFRSRPLKKDSIVVTVGLPPEHVKAFEKALAEVEKEHVHLDRGYEFYRDGKFDEAIKEYNIFLKKYPKSLSRGVAKSFLVDCYEKNKQYDKAYQLKDRVVQSYEISADNELFRIPEEERLKYLKYASIGEYEQAIIYAKKAIEASVKIPTNETGKPDPIYVERLNDLISAKDYILSLKKNQ